MSTHEQQPSEQRPSVQQPSPGAPPSSGEHPSPGGGGAPQPVRSRRVGAGYWRLGVAVLLGSGLVWTATATEGTWGARPHLADATVSTADGATFVGSASLVCPGWPGEDGEAGEAPPTVQVRAATSPEELGAPDEVGDGATLTAPEQGSRIRFPSGGTPDGMSVDGGWGAVAAGPDAAPGLVADQLMLSVDPGRRGLASTPCRAPAEVVHLLGGGDGAGRTEQVVVVNPGSDPVRVTVEVSGADGPAEVVGGSGLVVPPRGRAAYLLDALAPGTEAPAVTVRAEGGPVTAHLVEQQREGSVDLGVDVVPAAAVPGADLVVPALPGPEDGGARRTLVLRVFAPQEEAVVELRALTPQGARTPPEPVVRVPAGSTVDVDLGALDDDVLGLRLRSDAPVTAAARLQVAPSSDEPVVVEDVADTTDDASARTAAPDDAQTTAASDEAGTTSAPDEAGTTAAPDDAGTTAAPYDAGTTAGPESRQRVVRPAGELAWVTATTLARSPVGTALPGVDLAEGPGLTLSLAVSAVDAAQAQIVWLGEDRAVSVQDIEVANDTTVLVDVPQGAAAVWVRPVGVAGIAAALRLSGTDDVGPYLGAMTLPGVPWTREPTQVLPALP